MYAGLRFAVTLLVFFNTSSAFTKYRSDLKRKVDPDFKDGPPRPPLAHVH